MQSFKLGVWQGIIQSQYDVDERGTFSFKNGTWKGLDLGRSLPI